MPVGDLNEKVVRLFNDLEVLRRAFLLYPPSHPALQPARDRIPARVLALSTEGDSATVAFGPEELLWNDETVRIPEGAPAGRFFPLLFQLGLAALRLRLPEAGHGLAALAERLARLQDPPRESDRVKLLEEASSLAGVELVPIDLSVFELFSPDEEKPPLGSRSVWSALAKRLSQDGAFQLPGRIQSGELTPGLVRDILAETSDPETLFDHLFLQLSGILRSGPESRRPMVISEVREFFGELVGLLNPERRKLAVVAAIRHLPVTGEGDAFLAIDLLLDIVEFMVKEHVPVPDVVQRTLRGMAAPISETGEELPEDIAARARHLLAQIPPSEQAAELRAPAQEEPLSVAWADAPWTRELLPALREQEARLHLAQLLQEVSDVWEADELAERAAVRLAQEFAAAIDLGDLKGAVRIAPFLPALRSARARHAAFETAVPAAVRGFSTFERVDHPELTQVLISLGEGALPAILDDLAMAASLVVRKRLLEVVARQGERVVPYVLPLLDDSRWFVVRNAVFLLRKMGRSEAAPLLKARMAAAQPKLLAEILKALVELQDPEWFTLLTWYLDSEDEARRKVALEVASRIHHPDVVRALYERLQLRIGNRLREPFSLDLIRTLGRLGDPAALPVLREILSLRQWRFRFSLAPIRREAADVIGRLEGQDARRPALELAEDRDAGTTEGARARPEQEEDPEDEV
jgi:hypothetical protein